MTIKDIPPQLAEAGKIKIGWLGEERTSKKGTKYRRPEKLDHFVVTTTRRGEDGLLVVDEAVMALLPKDDDGHVRRLPVQLPFDDPADNFATSYVAYSGKSLACSGDGVVAIQRLRKGKDLDPPERRECPCKALEMGACKPNGRLSVILDVPGARLLGAAHVWRTTSQVSISNTMGSLQAMHTALGGELAGRPMWLVLRRVEHRRGAFYACHLEMREDDDRVRAAVPPVRPMPQIGEESPDEVADIQAEFYPTEGADAEA